VKFAGCGNLGRSRDILIGQGCGGEVLIGSDSDENKNGVKRGWSRGKPPDATPSDGNTKRCGISAGGRKLDNFAKEFLTSKSEAWA